MAFAIQRAKVQKLRRIKLECLRLGAFSLRLFVFVSSLSVLISITGCTSAEPVPDKPGYMEPEPNRTEIIEPEPNELQPPGIEPNAVGTVHIEPNMVDVNEVNAPRVSFHDKCAPILKAFVDDEGMVDYDALRRKQSELSRLLDEFAKLDPNEYKSWPQKDKIAFCINAYNLQTLRIIVANYPIDSYRYMHIFPDWGPRSIKHIDRRIGRIREQKFEITNEEFTLRQIQERFYKEFDEPRVFFALCDATLSSPPLRNEPYCGHKLDKQLNDQAKRFLSNPRAFRIEREKRRVYLSAMLQSTWHGKQFLNKYRTDKRFKLETETTRAVLNCLTNYISKEDLFFLERENYRIRYIRYDWTINDKSINKGTNR